MLQKVHKSIEISAPVEKVFSYLEDPSNNPEWIESMIDVKNISGSGPGSHYTCSWKMAGVQLYGETTRIEDIPNKRIVDKTRGVGRNTWTYRWPLATCSALRKLPALAPGRSHLYDTAFLRR